MLKLNIKSWIRAAVVLGAMHSAYASDNFVSPATTDQYLDDLFNQRLSVGQQPRAYTVRIAFDTELCGAELTRNAGALYGTIRTLLQDVINGEFSISDVTVRGETNPRKAICVNTKMIDSQGLQRVQDQLESFKTAWTSVQTICGEPPLRQHEMLPSLSVIFNNSLLRNESVAIHALQKLRVALTGASFFAQILQPSLRFEPISQISSRLIPPAGLHPDAHVMVHVPFSLRRHRSDFWTPHRLDTVQVYTNRMIPCVDVLDLASV